jgi:hypothetical protein
VALPRVGFRLCAGFRGVVLRVVAFRRVVFRRVAVLAIAKSFLMPVL